MGGPTGNGATEATASSPGRTPALALIDGHGEVVRLTETFRMGFALDGSPHLSIWDFLDDSDQRSRLGLVLEGRLLRADLALPSAMGSVAAAAEAVLDAAVTRHALLTVAPNTPDTDPRSGADTLLADPSLDESAAIVWIKDLSGRYLRINRRYTERLGIDAASIRGKSDAELLPAQVVEGPRLPGDRGERAEPVQLEYTVDAVEGRAALTVLRFPLHGLDGTAVAVCGVAAPIAEAGTARSEAERLLRIERWAGLSVAAIRAELIAEWQLAEVAATELGVEAGTVPPPAALAGADSSGRSGLSGLSGLSELACLREELEAARAATAELETLLTEARDANADLESRRAEEGARSAQLEEALAAARREADELGAGVATDDGEAAQREAEAAAELAAGRARAEAAEREAEAALERAEGAEGEIAAVRARAEDAEGEIAVARARADEAEREAAAAVARAQGAEGEIAAARAQADRAEREAVAARARVQGAEREVAAARARVAELKGAQATATSTADHGAAERAELERRLGEAQRQVEEAGRALAAERADAARGRAELTARAEVAERSLAASGAGAAQASAELAARVEAAERSLAAERAEAAQARAELAARAEAAERSLESERTEAAQASAELTARAEAAEAAIAEVRATGERAAVAARRAEAEAELSRGRADGLEAAVVSAREVEAERRAALEQARTEIASLQRALDQTRGEADSARAAAREATERLDRERHELAERPPAAPAASATPAVEVAPAPSGPTWSHSAQRAFTTSLAEASEWRTGLKDALRILGAEAGWDIAVAWCPDERTKAMRCLAMWMAAPGEHALFETATWQRRLSPTASEVARVAGGERAIWLGDLGSVDDAQVTAAAEEGMRAALLVPIRHAGETSGVLELLTRAPGALDAETISAMEAVGLQLAHFDHLLRLGAEPRWRLGRL